MASGAFFNPRTLLLVAPLVSSTCSLWYAHDQDFFLKLFTQAPVDRKKANEILPTYIKTFFDSGVWYVVSLLGITFWTSLANIWLERPLLESRGSTAWYGWTAALALGHLAYVPAVAWKLQALWEDNAAAAGTDNVGMLGRWLTVNMTRMLTTDLGAWLCAVVAISRTLAV
ncbi:integral membrane [Fusarium albosuccineum]|uniref:Integral membrane n=1 Tax=Fusarium albosuccineum TaxID=1237068 RepID=A0A8H4P8H1_9HYPO|nr:integral membrane [Fusarium albosuccineum]